MELAVVGSFQGAGWAFLPSDVSKENLQLEA